MRPARTPLDGYVQHGMHLIDGPNVEALGDCPFCGKPGKFSVHKERGVWKCWRCGRSGNLLGFLEEKTKLDRQRFHGAIALKLARDRGVKVKSLKAWGVGWDGTQYTIPADLGGKLHDLRRYRIGKGMRGTSGCKAGLVGTLDPQEPEVWLCEGEWDGVALWECLGRNKQPRSVAVVPGANTFPAQAAEFFRDRLVNVAFDHDEAGRRGSERIRRMLSGIARKIRYVAWPDDTPDGYDVRDVYASRGKEAVAVLRSVLSDTSPGQPPSENIGAPSYTLDGPGLSSGEAVEKFRKWMYLPNAEVLYVMFGTILANRLDGDPVWLFLVAPPGGSKTELLMSLADAPLTLSTTSLTPHALISGASGAGGEDPSLIPKLDGKVLVIKDFTTILDLPYTQREEIFGTLRDAYDGKTEKYWGGGSLHRMFKSRFGIIAGVTPMIEMFGAANSMLGERFLKYRLPQSGRIKTGQTIIETALDNIGKESRMREELQKVAARVLDVAVDPNRPPRLPADIRQNIIHLAQWTALLRGVVRRERYTQRVEFLPTSEVGTRIAKQLARLGMGVALFNGRTAVTKEEYGIIVSTARSTVPDRVEEIIKQLFLRAKQDYVPTSQVADWARLPSGTVRDLLQDLELLKIVQREPNMGRGAGHWRLSRTVLRLMRPLGLYSRDEAWRDMRRRVGKRRRGE